MARKGRKIVTKKAQETEHEPSFTLQVRAAEMVRDAIDTVRQHKRWSRSQWMREVLLSALCQELEEIGEDALAEKIKEYQEHVAWQK